MSTSSNPEETYLCVPIKGASTLSFFAGFSVAIVRNWCGMRWAGRMGLLMALKARGRVRVTLWRRGDMHEGQRVVLGSSG